ncbi:hypothetical protein [Ignisphaera cupida]
MRKNWQRILVAWGEANYLHVWGFHEIKLDSESIKMRYRVCRVYA